MSKKLLFMLDLSCFLFIIQKFFDLLISVQYVYPLNELNYTLAYLSSVSWHSITDTTIYH